METRYAPKSNGGFKYDDLIFQSTLDSYAPLKQKQARGNQAPFMTKELSKVIMTRSRIKNKRNKLLSRENFLTLKVGLSPSKENFFSLRH